MTKPCTFLFSSALRVNIRMTLIDFYSYINIYKHQLVLKWNKTQMRNLCYVSSIFYALHQAQTVEYFMWYVFFVSLHCPMKDNCNTCLFKINQEDYYFTIPKNRSINFFFNWQTWFTLTACSFIACGNVF